MTKLDGTAGQFFSVIADAINLKGTSRSAKGGGAHAGGNQAFRDLLHTVANPARRGPPDEDDGGSIKSGPLRTRVALLAELDRPVEEADRKLPDIAGEAADRTAIPDHAAAEVPNRPTVSADVAQQIGALPVVKPQVQMAGDDEKAPARKERSPAGRELPAAHVAGETKDVSKSTSRPLAPTSQAMETPHGDADLSPATPAATSFESVAANIERAAKGGGREALPAATKVTVVQQETHLPPLQPFTPAVQVAKAVVAELEGASAPPSSAVSNLAPAQGNIPDQPLKILTISLDPPALGNVMVRLRLTGESVSVHLAADRRDTSQMLDQQRDSIRDLMQSAGYVADVAPVQHGALDGFQSGSSQSQNSFSGQQQQPQSTSGGSNPSSGQSQDGAKRSRNEQHTSQETRHDQDVAPHQPRGAVYL